MIKIINMTKKYGSDIRVFDNLEMEILKGEFVQIIGESGAGKSTLLNILGLLDNDYEGEYYINGINTSKSNDTVISSLRCNKIGFVFQSYNLIYNMSVIDNILLPTIYGKYDKRIIKQRLEDLMVKFGIVELKDKNVQHLSGGEKQRVAIARAMIMDPEIILADEPTGNLDEKNANIIFNTLKELKELGKTIVMVTHNTYVDLGADRILVIRDGGIHEQKEIIC